MEALGGCKEIKCIGERGLEYFIDQANVQYLGGRRIMPETLLIN